METGSSMVPSAGTRGNREKLKHGKFHMNVRKNFFTLRVRQYWNKMLREIV